MTKKRGVKKVKKGFSKKKKEYIKKEKLTKSKLKSVREVFDKIRERFEAKERKRRRDTAQARATWKEMHEALNKKRKTLGR